MEIKELTCICCPMGCSLKIEVENNEILSVTGNTCKRGDIYARKELTNPTRIVTSTVRVKGKEMASVKTKTDIPKGKIMDCLKEMKNIEIEAPVHIGQIIIEDVAGTGVPVVATKEII